MYIKWYHTSCLEKYMKKGISHKTLERTDFVGFPILQMVIFALLNINVNNIAM